MPSPLGLTEFNLSEYEQGISNSESSLRDSYNSIFNKNKFYYRPTSADNSKSLFWSNENKSLHNTGGDDIYDVRTNSIIDYTDQYPAMRMKPEDFAYLKDLGVYPNNRLIVARRFSNPVSDDLTSENMNEPISTLVSWYNKFPLEVTFSEEWEEGSGDFLSLFDEMFGGVGTKRGMQAVGSFLDKIGKFPGFSEGLQFQILNALGVDTGFGMQNIPSGDPNLIQESKKRIVGNSLRCDYSINFETTYEQKFISDNDPTLVYLDIINNVLRFGSSESKFYIDSKGGDNKLTQFLNKFKSGDPFGAILDFLKAVGKAILNLGESLIGLVKGGIQAIGDGDFDSLGSIVGTAVQSISGPIVSKFRVTLSGVISSLTGEASTPWHITIGNPKSPIFCSGDMLCQNVKIELGETLAFNDLPSRIKISFTLKNARNLGIQEIFRKYNCGKGRSYINLDKDQFETPIVFTEKDTERLSEEFNKGVGKNLQEQKLNDPEEDQIAETNQTNLGSQTPGT